MTPQEKELFRKSLLRVLDANRTRFGLGVVPIASRLELFGFTLGNLGGAEAAHDLILTELDYLVSKQLVEEPPKLMSKENRVWRITTAGIAFLDSGA